MSGPLFGETYTFLIHFELTNLIHIFLFISTAGRYVLPGNWSKKLKYVFVILLISLTATTGILVPVNVLSAEQHEPLTFWQIIQAQDPHFNKPGSVLPQRYTSATPPTVQPILQSPGQQPVAAQSQRQYKTEDRDNVPYISVGVAAYDFIAKLDRQPEYRLEYRWRKLLGPVKPYIGLAGTLCPGKWVNSCVGKDWTGSIFVGGGGLIDYKLSDNVFLSPSLGLALYGGGTTDLDMDSFIVGRVQVELGYRFDDNSRLSLALSHYDNMGTGGTNPGTESLAIYVSVPID